MRFKGMGLLEIYADLRLFEIGLNAGYPTDKLVEEMSKSAFAHKTREAFAVVAKAMEEMKDQPDRVSKAFELIAEPNPWQSPIVNSFVRAGDIHGALDEAMKQLADFSLSERDLLGPSDDEIDSDRLINLSLWLRALECQLSSGIGILPALQSVADYSDEELSVVTLEIRARIREGDHLRECTARHPEFFLPPVALVLGIREYVGSGDIALKMADLLDDLSMG